MAAVAAERAVRPVFPPALRAEHHIQLDNGGRRLCGFRIGCRSFFVPFHGHIILQQLIDGHVENLANQDKLARLRQGLLRLPLGDGLSGHIQHFCKLLLRQSFLLSQQQQFL